MKKTILAALAAITLTSNASALELPEGFTCLDLFWESTGTINKTKLTDYDQCVIAKNWPDKTSGVLGDIFWVKVDDVYYSASFRQLRRFGSKEKAMAAFQQMVFTNHYNK